MARLMSVAHTQAAVLDRSKTVTRRTGWLFARPGDRLTLCAKVMGRRPGEPLVRLVDVEIVDIRRERLDTITSIDVAREGFTGWSPETFVRFYCDAFRVRSDVLVTRIEWRYL